jgi:hypothetical protein
MWSHHFYYYQFYLFIIVAHESLCIKGTVFYLLHTYNCHPTFSFPFLLLCLYLCHSCLVISHIFHSIWWWKQQIHIKFKSIYIYYIIYNTYTYTYHASYMFRTHLWPSSGTCIKKYILQNLLETLHKCMIPSFKTYGLKCISKYMIQINYFVQSLCRCM